MAILMTLFWETTESIKIEINGIKITCDKQLFIVFKHLGAIYLHIYLEVEAASQHRRILQ